MRKLMLVGLSVLTLLLCACAQKKSSQLAHPIQWGNYKCSAVSEQGKVYIGWSVDKEIAQKNAQAICKQESGEQLCQSSGCDDAEIEKDLD